MLEIWFEHYICVFDIQLVLKFQILKQITAFDHNPVFLNGGTIALMFQFSFIRKNWNQLQLQILSPIQGAPNPGEYKAFRGRFPTISICAHFITCKQQAS